MAQSIKKKCDLLFSKIIRYPGVCERCQNTVNLQCAHIISRRYSATRTNLDNAWCLCAKCHMRLTEWPREHSHFITETIGGEKYDELRQLAETPTKVSWEEELLRLRQVARDRGIPKT